MRRPITTKERLTLFLAAHGQCQRCGWRLSPGTRWEVDHVIPLALGGRDDVSNMQVLCQACHGSKTARQDLPAMGKARRIRARHLGAERPRHILPGSRRSRWKKRLDGSVQRRDPEGALPADTNSTVESSASGNARAGSKQ
jgi:5-methylcytosine-specific restriction enzyme A